MTNVPPPFDPANELERALADAQGGRLSVAHLMATLLLSQVFVLLDQDPGPSNAWNDSASPLVLTGSGGSPMLAIFTSPVRSSDWSMRFPQFAFGLRTDFKWLLKGVAPGVGIVINPGSSIGMEMPPSGVSQLRTETSDRV